MAVTTNLGLPLINDTMTANIVRDLNALAEDIDSKVMPKKSGILDTGMINVTDGTRIFRIGTDVNDPWIGTASNHDFRIISNDQLRGRVTSSGAFVWLDRIFTSRAGMQIGQDAAAIKNFHLVSDDVSTKATFRIYNGNYGSGSRMFGIDISGNVMIGSQAEAWNTEGWSKVVDIYRSSNLNLTLRTDQSHGVIAVHDFGFYGCSPGLIIGTTTAQELSFIVGKTRRGVFTTDGSFTVTTGGLGSATTQDAILFLNAGNIPTTGWRNKSIINSVNDSYGGAGLIFRAYRPSDNAMVDIKLNWNKGGGDIMTDSHIVKSPHTPSGGFEGQIWIQYS
ncbi:hypothetical protein M4D52_07385 [Paenibacillus lactis]|uniref:hypothetical protein n=1 Tax=Paenibacillus TaxID=44249 RepID=UPI00203E0915|nr:hypothetical protein [Paenibacillus lactis]MCM3493262.1 hypothetical protein [Paenibacillus lactis]